MSVNSTFLAQGSITQRCTRSDEPGPATLLVLLHGKPPTIKNDNGDNSAALQQHDALHTICYKSANKTCLSRSQCSCPCKVDGLANFARRTMIQDESSSITEHGTRCQSSVTCLLQPLRKVHWRSHKHPYAARNIRQWLPFCLGILRRARGE